jgi:hypothetical protein
MKNATATSQGRRRLLEADGEVGDGAEMMELANPRREHSARNDVY